MENLGAYASSEDSQPSPRIPPAKIEQPKDTKEIIEQPNKRQKTEQLPPQFSALAQEVEQALLHSGYIQSTNLPEPSSAVDSTLNQRISIWFKLKAEGKHFNERLINNHTFRNPQIMNKMALFMELNPYGTKLDKELFDPTALKLNSNSNFKAEETVKGSESKSNYTAKKISDNPLVTKEEAKSVLYNNFKKAKSVGGRKRRI